MRTREVKESPLVQGEDEEIQYQVTTTPWASSPSSVSVVVKDEDGNDVTSTVMPSGSASPSGDVITLPVLKLLTDGVYYRVEVKFTAGGSVWETYFKVLGRE